MSRQSKSQIEAHTRRFVHMFDKIIRSRARLDLNAEFQLMVKLCENNQDKKYDKMFDTQVAAMAYLLDHKEDGTREVRTFRDKDDKVGEFTGRTMPNYTTDERRLDDMHPAIRSALLKMEHDGTGPDLTTVGYDQLTGIVPDIDTLRKSDDVKVERLNQAFREVFVQFMKDLNHDFAETLRSTERRPPENDILDRDGLRNDILQHRRDALAHIDAFKALIDQVIDQINEHIVKPDDFATLDNKKRAEWERLIEARNAINSLSTDINTLHDLLGKTPDAVNIPDRPKAEPRGKKHRGDNGQPTQNPPLKGRALIEELLDRKPTLLGKGSRSILD